MSELSLIRDPEQSGGGRLDVEHAVRERYSSAARGRSADLCCPVEYDGRYLAVLPQELIERDYGCGDPSQYVAEGETVLDLGSGGGKICYIAAQIAGPRGRVIGVDFNEEMLDLARRYQDEIGRRLGYHNVEFHKGRIQDLALDLERFEIYLSQAPVQSAADWLRAEAKATSLRIEEPMIASESVDVVLSNCVLNLVDQAVRRQLFAEMHRVLRRGGRAVISDIVSDEPVPAELRADPKLWSGCISGAYLEHELISAFEDAGFYGIEILDRQREPWAVVEGIEFRSLTVRAYRGKEGPCLDEKQAVIYRGPWRTVSDDDGNTLRRGVRTEVCGKNYEIYNRPPYADQIEPIPPRVEVPPDDDCCSSGKCC